MDMMLHEIWEDLQTGMDLNFFRNIIFYIYCGSFYFFKIQQYLFPIFIYIFCLLSNIFLASQKGVINAIFCGAEPFTKLTWGFELIFILTFILN